MLFRSILNYTSALSRFGLAHLNQQTNISSPFISVYDNLSHAEQVARHWAEAWGEEVLVVSVDTRHFARGPVFRAADLLKVCPISFYSFVLWKEGGFLFFVLCCVVLCCGGFCADE